MLKYKVSIVVLLILLGSVAHSQQQGAYFYRVLFSDKGGVVPADLPLSGIISEKAIARREKNGTASTDFYDIPVYRSYTDQIASLGATLHSTSRWMNSGLFHTDNPGLITTISALSFVEEVILVKEPGLKSARNKLTLLEATTAPYNFWPIIQIKGIQLHNSGYDGKGVLLAVLDAGFDKADIVTSLSHLHSRNGVILTRDFVTGSTNVYGSHSHGTAVLTALAGDLPNMLRGSAPGAEYILLRSEDGNSEYPVEEDFWVAAAELADSAGVDIISSSLGYTEFDNPSMNYSYSDLDGQTAFITRATNIAFTRNILIVNSAGNSRNDPWLYINTPSDGAGVLSTAAVDIDGNIALFSSSGPSADGRIKPDVAAAGVAVAVQTSSAVRYINGTSFSCPVISGMAASLLQANMEANASDLMSAIKSSADRYYKPDSLYGYGIPDFTKAYHTINKRLNSQNISVVVMPNPASDYLVLHFDSPSGLFDLTVYSPEGRLLLSSPRKEYSEHLFYFEGLTNLPDGLLLFKVNRPEGIVTLRVIKIRP